jgi:hypothetical protein
MVCLSVRRVSLYWALRQRHVSTFDVQKLTMNDLLDLSGITSGPVLVSGADRPAIITFKSKLNKRIPFPAGTRGFLYFQPGPDHAPIAGNIRFRLLPSPCFQEFARGVDLSVHEGAHTPWQIPLASVLKSKIAYAAIATSLLRDDLVCETLLSQRESYSTNTANRSQIIHSLDQLFVLDLQQRAVHIIVASGPEMLKLKFVMPIDSRGNHNIHPWFGTCLCYLHVLIIDEANTGKVICSFEATTSPAGNAAIAIRLQEVIEPIQYADPDYDGYLPLPQVGRLLPTVTGKPKLHALSHRHNYFVAYRALIKSSGSSIAGYVSPIMTDAGRELLSGSRRRIRRFNPVFFTSADVIDLSNQIRSKFYFTSQHSQDRGVFQPQYCEHYKLAFPPHTLGYVYFHPHLDPICSSLRFRVIQESTGPKSAFDVGNDLLSPNGLPWEAPISRLFTSTCGPPLQDMIAREGLMSMFECKQIISNIPKPRLKVQALGDVVMLRLAAVRIVLHLGKGLDLLRISIRHPWKFAAKILKQSSKAHEGYGPLQPPTFSKYMHMH